MNFAKDIGTVELKIEAFWKKQHKRGGENDEEAIGVDDKSDCFAFVY
jgi:hypothetical protein